MKIAKPKKSRLASARPTRAVTSRSADDVIELVPALVALKSILVPIDFSAAGRAALKYGRRFAEQFGAKVTLLYVIEPIPYPDFASVPAMETRATARAAKLKLEELALNAGLPAAGLDGCVVRVGSPFQEIIAAARSLKTDLIVISTHGYSGLKHVLLGSTAERVVRHAPCPVLVVRQREREFV